MQTVDLFNAQPESELVTMFQVEELEERLENKAWEASASAGSNSNGPYCEAKVSCKF